MKKEFYSNNGFTTRGSCWVSKYKIEILYNYYVKNCRLYEYNKNELEYKLIHNDFNEYSFLEHLKSNEIKKYFSCRDDEITG